MTEQVERLLNESRLNWTVRTEGVQTLESGLVIPNAMSIIREDTNAPLAVRTDAYYPFQNHELMELLSKVTSLTGLELHRGGFFGSGEKVFVQLKSDDLRIGTDRVEGYVTGVNSFDGSTSLAFGPSTLTISCMNTFFAAFKNLKTKVRHTKNMVVRVDDICRELEGAVEEEKRIFRTITRFTEISIDDVLKEKVTRALFNIDKNVELNDEDKISGVTRNRMSRFYIDMNGEIQEKGETMWGLFSGVTKYTTHSMTKNDNTEAKMFGAYGRRELEIFNSLASLEKVG